MKKLEAYFCGWGQHWHLGTLAHADRTLLFEYSDQALQRRIELSPILLPLRKAAYQGFPSSQDNLPGLIADSLPDGWGRRLMDGCFQNSGRSLADISPLDRLGFIHDRAMGALTFAPADALSKEPEYLELLELAQGAQVILAGHDTDILQQLALAGGSPHGARPKVLVQYDPSSGQVSTQQMAAGTPWLVKFQAQGETKEVCLVETLYSAFARKCGLDMPATHYFDLNKKLAGFGIARFDRERGMRVPTLSLAGLLDDNFRVPTRDYEALVKATRALTKDEREVRKAYERCIFNVVFNNRDDHTKNFAYVMNEALEWKLAPCYDLTYNTGFNGEHQMTISGEGRYPGLKHLIALSVSCDIPEPWARQAIERITEVAGMFRAEVKDWKISKKTFNTLAQSIDENRNRML